MVKIKGSRSHNTIALPLDIPNVKITKVRQNERGDYVITVESTLESTRCQYCGRKLSQLHARGREIELRHLPILGRRVYIHLRPKQFKCPDCGDKMTTQTLDWYESNSPHTKAYDSILCCP